MKGDNEGGIEPSKIMIDARGLSGKRVSGRGRRA